MKILIIEDEEILAKVLQEKFDKEKFEAKIVSNGSDAVESVKDFQPDIILLDLILPQKDGFEILEELKRDPNFQNIPVVVLSGLGQDEEIKKALSLGAADYLVKTQHPIKEVVERVKKLALQPR